MIISATLGCVTTPLLFRKALGEERGMDLHVTAAQLFQLTTACKQQEGSSMEGIWDCCDRKHSSFQAPDRLAGLE